MCKRKNYRGEVFLSAYFLFAGLVLMSLTVPSLADGTCGSTTTISEVPVKVNVLNGVSISDEEIKEIFKGVNDILKKRGVNVRVASDPNINRNVGDTGNDDGDIQNGEMSSLDSSGRKELDSNFGKGKGIKIYFANKLGDSNSTRGLSSMLISRPIMFTKAALQQMFIKP